SHCDGAPPAVAVAAAATAPDDGRGTAPSTVRAAPAGTRDALTDDDAIDLVADVVGARARARTQPVDCCDDIGRDESAGDGCGSTGNGLTGAAVAAGRESTRRGGSSWRVRRDGIGDGMLDECCAAEVARRTRSRSISWARTRFSSS